MRCVNVCQQYVVYLFAHDAGPHSGARNSSFGIATLAPDRFAGVKGGPSPGTVAVSRPLSVSGSSMVITLDVLATGGYVTVGIVDGPSGLSRSSALVGNVTDGMVQFPKAPSGLLPLLGKNATIQLTVVDAVVYTVGFI